MKSDKRNKDYRRSLGFWYVAILLLPAVFLNASCFSDHQNNAEQQMEDSLADPLIFDDEPLFTAEQLEITKDSLEETMTNEKPNAQPIKTAPDSRFYKEGYSKGYDDGEEDAETGNEWGSQYDDACRYSGNARKEYKSGYEDGYEDGYNDCED